MLASKRTWTRAVVPSSLTRRTPSPRPRRVAPSVYCCSPSSSCPRASASRASPSARVASSSACPSMRAGRVALSGSVRCSREMSRSPSPISHRSCSSWRAPFSYSSRPSTSCRRPSRRSASLLSSSAWVAKGSTVPVTCGRSSQSASVASMASRWEAVKPSSEYRTTVPVPPATSGICSPRSASTWANSLSGSSNSLVSGRWSESIAPTTVPRTRTQARTKASGRRAAALPRR